MKDMSRRELLDLLDALRQQVAEGVTLDGDLRFRHTSCRGDVDHYDVTASYRVGRHVRLVGVKAVDGAA